VVCPSTGLCLEQCAAGFGAGQVCPGSVYGAGDVITFHLTGAGGVRYQTISAWPLSGLWCAASACFAADQSGGLFASPAPGDQHAWWQTLRVAAAASATQPNAVTALACPSAMLCLALTSDGEVLHGPPPATRAKVRSALRAALGLAAQHARLRRLLRNDGYREIVDTPAPGRLTVIWSEAHSAAVIGRVAQSIQHAGATRITIGLTRRGKRLLETGRRLRLTARGAFAPSGTPPLTSTGNLTLP
jgi:hypothetical protein